MLVYLDSNVFDFVAKNGDLKTVASMLKQRRIAVLASEYHKLETLAISDLAVRRRQLTTMTTLASRYTERPLAWRHAQELRFEIVRCRREWIDRFPREKEVHRFLRSHKEMWNLAQEGELPSLGVSRYRSDSEAGIGVSRKYQKFVRNEQVTAKKPATLTYRWQGNGSFVAFALTDPEEYWRNECAMAWFQAIVNRNPASRDYADYLAPYLKTDVFAEMDYASLWKHEICGTNVPLNRITGLADFFQLQAKIGHGNAYDRMHANFGTTVDAFLTCDKAFCNVLSSLKAYLGGSFATPVLVDRGACDVHAELEQKLDAMMGGH